MKKYRSHKIVEAGVTQDRTVDGHVKVDDEWIEVPGNIFARGWPVFGVDYLVRYEDGYISWSPKKAFEDGYDEVT